LDVPQLLLYFGFNNFVGHVVQTQFFAAAKNEHHFAGLDAVTLLELHRHCHDLHEFHLVGQLVDV